jgi:amino acid transporter
LSGVSDNALYPILFLDCLVQLLKVTNTGDDDNANTLVGDEIHMRWAFIMTITLALTYLSYRGLDVVGNVAIIVCGLSLLPFLVFCVIGSFKVKPSRWLETPPGGFWAVDWRLLLNTFFWNINYWESAASFSGDVKNPDKNYPRGMGIAVIMVFLATFIPVLIGTSFSLVRIKDSL